MLNQQENKQMILKYKKGRLSYTDFPSDSVYADREIYKSLGRIIRGATITLPVTIRCTGQDSNLDYLLSMDKLRSIADIHWSSQ